MIEEKEKRIEMYHQLTVTILDALKNGREDEVPLLLEKRENAIKNMNEIDNQAKHIVMNARIRDTLTKILPLEQQIQNLLLNAMKKYKREMVSARNETFLSKHYEHAVILPYGAFYDKKN
ncbi:flagellar protein FliT [Ectobacillus polymachus]|uniref:flagellar protein FliT n=1 Tax=Ectobacillus polymachus TaxID=1508806 RepID=UPI003A87363F